MVNIFLKNIGNVYIKCKGEDIVQVFKKQFKLLPSVLPLSILPKPFTVKFLPFAENFMEI